MPAKKKHSNSPALDDFESLVDSIVQIHHQAQDFATKAVNVGLTLRNWLIGHRIVEFEQNGKDRAAYGERLLPELAKRLASAGLKRVDMRVDMRELRRFRLLYTTYPQIRETVTPELLARSRAFVYKVGADRRAAPRFSRIAPLIHNSQSLRALLFSVVKT